MPLLEAMHFGLPVVAYAMGAAATREVLLPYLQQLSQTYGLATSYDAGYPIQCPGLPAYLLLTKVGPRIRAW